MAFEKLNLTPRVSGLSTLGHHFSDKQSFRLLPFALYSFYFPLLAERGVYHSLSLLDSPPPPGIQSQMADFVWHIPRRKSPEDLRSQTGTCGYGLEDMVPELKDCKAAV